MPLGNLVHSPSFLSASCQVIELPHAAFGRCIALLACFCLRGTFVQTQILNDLRNRPVDIFQPDVVQPTQSRVGFCKP
jgi:hypothetical protein